MLETRVVEKVRLSANIKYLHLLATLEISNDKNTKKNLGTANYQRNTG